MLVCWLGRIVVLSFLCHAQMNKVIFFLKKKTKGDSGQILSIKVRNFYRLYRVKFTFSLVNCFQWVGDNRLGSKIIYTNFIDFYCKIIAFHTNCRASYLYVNRNISFNNISEISTLPLSCKIMSSNWVLMSTCGQERLYINCLKKTEK